MGKGDPRDMHPAMPGSGVNKKKTDKIAKAMFPKEEFATGSEIVLNTKSKKAEIPSDLDGISVAKSKLTGSKNEMETTAKEIRQAKILADNGDYVCLIPKMKDKNGKDIPGPDAIRNGVLFEFKTVGSIDNAVTRFRKSLQPEHFQCENIFIRIQNPNISIKRIKERIHGVLTNPKYKGGTEGILAVHLDSTKQTYYYNISDLK